MHVCEGLYDPCLALTIKKSVVGNAFRGDGKGLVFITDANQEGKSTFLRAERKSGGARTFKLAEGELLQTSFGEDLYHKVFQAQPGAPAAGRAWLRCL